MKDLFFEILSPIKESTGLEIDLYSLYGDLIFSTNDESPSYKFVYHDIDAFNEITIADAKADITYFLVDGALNEKRLVGAIMGSNEVSRNYAIMVGKLLETNIVALTESSGLDLSTKLALFLSGELKKPQADALRLDFNRENANYFLITALVLTKNGKSKEKLEALISFVQTMSEVGDIVLPISEDCLVFLKKNVGIDEYSSSTDFAYILYDSIKEELSGFDLKLSAGGNVRTIDEVLSAFKGSRFALDFGLRFDPKGNIYSFKEYAIVKMLSDIPKDTLKSYFKSISDEATIDILSDVELMDTADAFLKNSLNISETSRNIYMHRNTLINKLDKIESSTGLNLRHFNDALSFKLMATIYLLTR